MQLCLLSSCSQIRSTKFRSQKLRVPGQLYRRIQLSAFFLLLLPLFSSSSSLRFKCVTNGPAAQPSTALTHCRCCTENCQTAFHHKVLFPWQHTYKIPKSSRKSAGFLVVSLYMLRITALTPHNENVVKVLKRLCFSINLFKTKAANSEDFRVIASELIQTLKRAVAMISNRVLIVYLCHYALRPTFCGLQTILLFNFAAVLVFYTARSTKNVSLIKIKQKSFAVLHYSHTSLSPNQYLT